jgi:hypothetical protein
VPSSKSSGATHGSCGLGLIDKDVPGAIHGLEDKLLVLYPHGVHVLFIVIEVSDVFQSPACMICGVITI